MLATILSCPQIESAYSQVIEQTWKPIAEDLEVLRAQSNSYLFFRNQILFVRTKLKRYRLSVVRAEEFGTRRSSVKTLSKASKAVLGINANFFDENGDPLGLVISRGITFHKIHKGGDTLTGVLQVSHSGISVVNRFEFNSRSVTEAIQAGPRLLEHGELVPGLRDRSRHTKRSGVCLDKNGYFIFYAVESGYLGVSIDQLTEILKTPEIGCSDALNLDGGGSSQMFISNELRGKVADFDSISIQGQDDIPVMLGLVAKD